MMKKFKSMNDSNMLLTITLIAFVLMYVFAIVVMGSGFRKPQAFFNILNTNASLIILACGLSIVMITGGIDISVGGVTGLITMCCAVYLDKPDSLNPTPGNVFVSLLIAIAIGIAFGVVQGYLIAYLNIQPFIVTLAGMFFARGLTTIIRSAPFNVANENFVKLKDTRITVPGMGSVNNKGIYVPAYVEIGAIVAILIVILLFLLLRYTKLGRSFYAVGGNLQSSLMLGINVKRVRFLAQLFSGILAGIGGFVYFLHCGSGAVTNAQAAEMDAIASSIIGGTMLTGGVGNIIGTMFGVLSLSTIQNIVSSAGLDEAWWTGITNAAMLCIFLVIQSVIMAQRKKKSAN